jgi:sodium pump decarboxylase gamma subunit
MNDIEQGLIIMVMGLGLTFSVLVIFIGIITLLKRLFPASPEPDSSREERAKLQTVGPLARDTTEEEIAAALTAALAYLYSHELCRSNLGQALEEGPGPWWRAGQLQ